MVSPCLLLARVATVVTAGASAIGGAAVDCEALDREVGPRDDPVVDGASDGDEE